MAGKSDIIAGKAVVILGVNASPLVSGLKSAGKQLTRFGKNVSVIGAGIASAGAAIVGPLTAAVVKFAHVGDVLDKMSKRTGISGAALSELGFAAEQSGQNLSVVEGSIKKMQKALGDSAKATKSLKSIGVEFADIKGKAPDEQFERIGDAIGAIQDPTERAAAAMKIFGKSGTALIPMFGNIKALREEARELGLSPSPESIQAAADLTDAINRVRRVIGATVFAIGGALAPAVISAMGYVKGFLLIVQKWAKEHAGLIKVVAGVGVALSAIGTAIAFLGGFFILAGAALNGLATAITALAGIIGVLGGVVGFLLSPIGLVIAGVAGLVAAWASWSKSGQATVATIVAGFNELVRVVQQTFGGIFDAIAAGDLALAGNIAITGLKLVVAEGMDWIVNAISGSWGDALGTITSQILEGDFSGAWTTVLSGMASVFDSFTAGLGFSFGDVGKTIINAWQSVTEFIANSLLWLAEKTDQVLEAIGLGFGFAEDLRQGRSLDTALAKKGLGGGTTTDKIGKDTVHGQISASADAMRKSIGDIEEGAKNFNERTKGGASRTSGLSAGLQANLDALTEQAKQRAIDKAKREEALAGTGELAGAGGPSIFGTFSARELANSGTIGLQQRMVDHLKGIEKNTGELVDSDDSDEGIIDE